MAHDEFLRLVAAMRQAQRDYFRTRDHAVLQESKRLEREGIGFDIRKSQCDLGERRVTRPHAPVIKKARDAEPMPLFGEG